MKNKKELLIFVTHISAIFYAVYVVSAFNSSISYNDAIKSITSINIEKTRFNLKEVKKNKNRQIQISLKNTGEFPLVIYSVNASCECLNIKLPKKPILPGKESKIKLIYNSKKLGEFVKTIKIYGNYENSPKGVLIKGKCIP